MARETPSLDTIFCAAVEITSAEARASYVQQACGGDLDLRGRVEKLVAAHFQAGSFMESPVLPSPLTGEAAASAQFATVGAPANEQPGTVIGPYKLLEQIGEGGFGVVFMAEQQQPIRRKVALKVLKPGMDSRQVIARFEAERQALALMDHPNIAKVLDAGQTGGRPYFVMELVRGVAITEFCDQSRLTARERLSLFAHVCQAVQHAHQKGIIHRDIKPSNVLVTLHDGIPAVKVIDFGIAKALGQQLTDKTMFTGFAQMIGTPMYMSPEQAAFGNLDVDTRSDIYSLGVLLYELLTGKTPFGTERFREAGYDEMRRIIREEEPPKPSTRISTLGQAATTISAQRQCDPKHLRQLFRGELDWIVMKALEKDRNRRYETASAFEADVQRYLHDEPVQAGRPSTRYWVRKFLKRNRRPVGAAGLMLLALIVAVVGTSVGLVRARQAQRDANKDRDKALVAEQSARESEADTRAFSKFLVEDVLSAARPEGWGGGLGTNVTLRRALDDAAQRIGEQFQGRPRAEAEARQALGYTYHLLGENALAEPHLRRAVELRRQALGPNDHDTLIGQRTWGEVLSELGRNDEALTIVEKTLDQFQNAKGPEHAETARTHSTLAYILHRMGRNGEAVATYKKAVQLETAALGPDDLNTLASMNMLATSLLAVGREAEAIQLYEKTWERKKATLGPNHPSTLMSMCGLAAAYEEVDRARDALPLYKEAIKQSTAKLGADHPYTLSFVGALMWAHHHAGQFADVIRLGEEALPRCTAKLGADDMVTLNCAYKLALGYLMVGRTVEATRLLEDTLRRRRARPGPEDNCTLVCMNGLALAYRRAGRLPEAIGLSEQAVKLSRIKLGNNHRDTIRELNSLALAYQDAGRLTDALPLYEEGVRLTKAKWGLDHSETLMSMHNLAWGYQNSGRLLEAAALYEEVLPRKDSRMGRLNMSTMQTLYNLATTYRLNGQLEQAEAAYRDLLARHRKLGPENLYATITSALLGHIFVLQNRSAEAESQLRESLALLPKKMTGDWRFLAAQSSLGGALVAQKKYAEAEPLLLAAYQGLKSQQKTITPECQFFLTTAAERLVQLYDAQGANDKAQSWRHKLELERPTEKPEGK